MLWKLVQEVAQKGFSNGYYQLLSLIPSLIVLSFIAL